MPTKRRKPTTLRVLLGKRIRELRRGRGLSLEALGDRAGVDEKYLQHVETAKQAASVDTIDRIASALGVSAADLFTFPDETPSEMREQAALLFAKVSEEDVRRVIRVLRALVG